MSYSRAARELHCGAPGLAGSGLAEEAGDAGEEDGDEDPGRRPQGQKRLDHSQRHTEFGSLGLVSCGQRQLRIGFRSRLTRASEFRIPARYPVSTSRTCSARSTTVARAGSSWASAALATTGGSFACGPGASEDIRRARSEANSSRNDRRNRTTADVDCGSSHPLVASRAPIRLGTGSHSLTQCRSIADGHGLAIGGAHRPTTGGGLRFRRAGVRPPLSALPAALIAGLVADGA